MPKLIPNYEPLKPTPKHPVEKWLESLKRAKNGSHLLLKKGKDFKECSPHSLCQYLWKYGRDNRIPLRCIKGKDFVRLFLK